MNLKRLVCVAAAVGLVPVSAGLARAEVIEATAGGFSVKHVVTVPGTPQEAYRKLVANVGDWWNGAHSFSGDAHNLSIDARPMGCFCERLPEGGGVRHLEVVYVAPGKMIRMLGGLGPMQSMAVNGVMTWTFAAGASGTTLVTVMYTAGGYQPGGLQEMAQAADGMIGGQVGRYRNYVETGRATAAK